MARTLPVVGADAAAIVIDLGDDKPVHVLARAGLSTQSHVAREQSAPAPPRPRRERLRLLPGQLRT